MAGFAGAFVDREVSIILSLRPNVRHRLTKIQAETRGLDYIDRERAKRQANDDLSQQYDQNYQQNDQDYQQNDQQNY